jgi:hypothetical protein
VHANGGWPFKVVLTNIQGKVKVDVMKQKIDFQGVRQGALLVGTFRRGLCVQPRYDP